MGGGGSSSLVADSQQAFRRWSYPTSKEALFRSVYISSSAKAHYWVSKLLLLSAPSLSLLYPPYIRGLSKPLCQHHVKWRRENGGGERERDWDWPNYAWILERTRYRGYVPSKGDSYLDKWTTMTKISMPQPFISFGMGVIHLLRGKHIKEINVIS